MNTAPLSTHGVFALAGDCLEIGGVALDRLAERVGSTPFFAYERARISANVARLRATLPRELQLHYSLKANPMAALIAHMATLVDGFDVASAAEMTAALDSGMAPAEISFAGPGKRDQELGMAIAAGVIIHLESEGELLRATRLGERLGIRPRVALRINPDFELKLSGMKMAGGAKPFGIDAEDAPRILRSMAGLGVEFVGFHIYCGSQNLQPAAIVAAQAGTFELALRLAQDAPAPVRLLNIGGGFGIPYFPGESALDLAPIGDHLAACLPRINARLPEAKIVLELGRYLVGDAGVYVTRVVDRKVSRGKVFLITDGGMNHHLAASGNLGQKIRRNFPAAIGNRMNSPANEIVSVSGPLCTPLDLLVHEAPLAEASVGDLVVVFQSGAYGLSASPSGFLSHAPAREVLI